MNEQAVVTVADLLPRPLSLGPAMEEAARVDPELRALSAAWNLVGDQAAEKLRGLLADCDLFELLGKAWVEAKSLRDYADPARHPPGETAVVPLAEHSFVREIHPTLTVTLGGCAPATLRFTIALAARFRGLSLTIEDGHIIALGLGETSVSAQLKYGSVNLTDEMKSDEMELPGRHVFAAPGMRIPPP
jgi:hypothetical protein